MRTNSTTPMPRGPRVWDQFLGDAREDGKTAVKTLLAAATDSNSVRQAVINHYAEAVLVAPAARAGWEKALLDHSVARKLFVASQQGGTASVRPAFEGSERERRLHEVRTGAPAALRRAGDRRQLESIRRPEEEGLGTGVKWRESFYGWSPNGMDTARLLRSFSTGETYFCGRTFKRGVFGKLHVVLNASGEAFALKEFRLSKQSGKKTQQSFVWEVGDEVFRLERVGQHVHDAFVDQAKQKAYVVMDLLEHDLHFLGHAPEIPNNPARLLRSWERQLLVKDIFGQAAQRLYELHERGLMHRDIKPANLLLKFEQDTPRVLLADFGLATSDEKSTQVAGNKRYAPPEQQRVLAAAVEGEEGALEEEETTPLGPDGKPVAPYDAKVDVWALGCCMLEFAMGEYPFRDRHDDLLSWRTHAEVLEALAPKLMGLEPRLAQLIAWTLDPDPTTRPSSRELAEHLASSPLLSDEEGPLADDKWAMLDLKKPIAEQIDALKKARVDWIHDRVKRLRGHLSSPSERALDSALFQHPAPPEPKKKGLLARLGLGRERREPPADSLQMRPGNGVNT